MGIEGDYLETKDGLFFDVKGLLHPNDRKIAFIRFYPDSDGDRNKDGIKYRKIYEIKARYGYLRENYPKYLFDSENHGMQLQAVPNEDIKQIYNPRTYLRTLLEKKGLSRIEESSLRLCQLFLDEAKVPINAIGITGSPMVGLNKNESDIDLVIYGTDVSLAFQGEIQRLFEAKNDLRCYNMEEYHTHYEWRVGGSDIPFDDFLVCEKRKLHQGMFEGFEFFIRYLKSPEDWVGEYKDYSYENCGRIQLDATITDSTYALFTPCEYNIEPHEILEISDAADFDKDLDLKYVNSFRGRFCEHAKEGEKVYIEGKLEKVHFKDETYYRVLLQDQETDKMLQLH